MTHSEDTGHDPFAHVDDTVASASSDPKPEGIKPDSMPELSSLSTSCIKLCAKGYITVGFSTAAASALGLVEDARLLET